MLCIRFLAATACTRVPRMQMYERLTEDGAALQYLATAHAAPRWSPLRRTYLRKTEHGLRDTASSEQLSRHTGMPD